MYLLYSIKVLLNINKNLFLIFRVTRVTGNVKGVSLILLPF